MRRISIIVPVLNEQETIFGLLEHVKGLLPSADAEVGEVIVVDGDSRGSTIAVIGNRRDGPDVRTLTASPGRAAQMNAGSEVAQGDFLLFLHADTLLPDTAVRDVAGCLADESTGLGSFGLAVDGGGPLLGLLIRLADRRNRLLRTPYGDQALFLRREVFAEVGGFPDQPIMEDVDLARRVRKSGYSIRILHSRVVTSARRWEKEGLLRCTARNLALRVLHALGASPHRLARWYANHKGES